MDPDHRLMEVQRPPDWPRQSPPIPARVAEAYHDALRSRGYVNARKLQGIFEFWLTDLLEICLREGFLPRHTLDLFSAYSRIARAAHFEKGAGPPHKRMLWRLVSRLPLDVGVFPGTAVSYSDKIRSMALHHRLAAQPLQVDGSLAAEVIDSLRAIAPEYAEAVRVALPRIFFSSPVARARGFPSRLRGSPISLLQGHLLKSLFVQVPIDLTGLQHGGCYGEFLVNRCESFECSISDRYLHWGFGERNVRQTRFPERPTIARRPRRLVLVGWVDGDEPFFASYFGGISEIYGAADEGEQLLAADLASRAPVHYMAHPKNPRQPPFYQEVTRMSRLEGEAEASLFVLDRPGQTFMYQAIYQRLPFVMLFDESWGEHLTPRFRSFLQALHEAGLLYWHDERDAFLERVAGLLRDGYPGDLFEAAQRALEVSDA